MDVQINFDYRTMSGLTRKPSKGTFRLTTEDYSSCLDQKNSIIATLQAEVEQLRTNQQKYDRVKEELTRFRSRYETLLRDQETSLCNNQDRLELSVRSVYELRLQAQHLAEQLQLREQALKESRYSCQQLREQENKKEDEATQVKIRLQEQRSLAEVRKIEEERTRLQIAQVREEVEKGRREAAMIRNQTDSIKEKSYKTQTYIRNLKREQSQLNESLSKIEDENSQLNSHLGELDTIISINSAAVINKEKDCQELQFLIANKELERRKLENQNREKVKQLSAEKERWRALNEQFDGRKQAAARIESQVADTSAEINLLLGKNEEFTEANQVLNDDLQICERHLANVGKINNALDSQIQNLKTTNMKAITKLQQPFTCRTNSYQAQPTGKWGVSSRVTDFETGDFEKRSNRF